jgi:hypothetical protein
MANSVVSLTCNDMSAFEVKAELPEPDRLAWVHNLAEGKFRC